MIRADKYKFKIYRLNKDKLLHAKHKDQTMDKLRADKDGDGEISREDWFTALTKAGVEITK